MSKARVLLQLDCDRHASSFDALVAVDAGVEQLFQYGGVEPASVQPLVHGAMFTRGGEDLRSTAIFLGGSDVRQVAAVREQVERSFFGPVRVSWMMDPNGCNTTAVAACLSAGRHRRSGPGKVVVVGGTGPVGSRIARLCAREGDEVMLVSRSRQRAEQVRAEILMEQPEARVEALEATSPAGALALVQSAAVIYAAGAAGMPMLPEGWWELASEGTVAVDCNAVPPAGLPGVSVMDRGATLGPATVYGAIGIGGLKMKIHKACIERLFHRNDLTLDTVQILGIGRELVSGQ